MGNVFDRRLGSEEKTENVETLLKKHERWEEHFKYRKFLVLPQYDEDNLNNLIIDAFIRTIRHFSKEAAQRDKKQTLEVLETQTIPYSHIFDALCASNLGWLLTKDLAKLILEY